MKHYDTYYTHNHLVWMQNKQILGTSKSLSPMNSLIPPKHVQEPLGGFIWPPRSYTCSFCKRKFRSAQALGGHMNVHRRDRAKLKQSPPPQNQSTTHVQRHTSYHQQAKGFKDHIYGFPQENASKNRSFQDHSLVSTSLDKKIPGLKSGVNISCNNGLLETTSASGRYVFDDSLVTVKDGKRCKKSDRYSECSSMEDIDLELRLGHSPAVCAVEFSSVELGKV